MVLVSVMGLYSGIPCELRFACSRPLTLCEGDEGSIYRVPTPRALSIFRDTYDIENVKTQKITATKM